MSEGGAWNLLEPLLLQRCVAGAASGLSPHRRLHGFLRAAATAIVAAAPLQRSSSNVATHEASDGVGTAADGPVSGSTVAPESVPSQVSAGLGFRTRV